MKGKRRIDSEDDISSKRAKGSDDGDPDIDEIPPGIIMSVTLRNFMCHENLKFDFAPKVNFITGCNGSGKSAVLTGIMLALGGKSSHTGRFHNLKGFIKTGKQTASVSVTLSNTGDNPYQPDFYGSKIICERVINSDGSSYKLKSANGRVHSTAKDELDRILHHLNIQVDNPVSILTQETSRSFLNSKNSKDKYKFFFKATHLEKLKSDCHLSSLDLEDAEERLRTRRKAIPIMEKEIIKWKAIKDHEMKIKEYENELEWSLVKNAEKNLDSKVKEFTIAEKKVDIFKEKMGKSKEKHTEAVSALDATKKQLDDCIAVMDPLERDINKLATEVQTLNGERMELKGKLNKTDSEIRKNELEISNLEKNITEMRNKSQNDISIEKRKREEMITCLKQELSQFEEDLNNLKEQREQLFEHINTMKRDSLAFQADKGLLARQIEKTVGEIDWLKSRIQNPINKLGPDMQAIINAINQRRDFKRRPIGPIGNLMTVNEKEWSFAVEQALKQNFLTSFCCDNFKDREILNKIFKQHCRQQPIPSIIVSEFLDQVHNVTQYKVKSNHPTVLDMVTCENPVVANCLIDQKKVEGILLIKDEKEAVDLMMENPPLYCGSSYVPRGDQIYPHPKYRYYSCKSNKIPILKSADESDIRLKEQALQELKNEYNRKNALIKNKDEEFKKLTTSKSSITTSITNLHCKCEQLRQKISDVENVEDPKDLISLQEELQYQDDMIQNLKKQNSEWKERYKQKMAECEKLKKEIEINQNHFKEKLKERIKLQEQSLKQEEDKENYKTKMYQYQQLHEEGVEAVLELKKEHDELFNAVESLTAEAEELCPRINTKRSEREIKELIQSTKKILEEQSKCHRNSIVDHFYEKQKSFEEVKKDLQKREAEVKEIAKMLERRRNNYLKLLKNTTCLVNYAFDINLKTNKFSGYLDINHDKKTLVVMATPTSSASRGKTQNTKELSGGEQSYVTVALLLALWETVRMPFRILDEYDVFMDSANRQFSLSIMVKKALSEENVEFIFLSPQDLPPMDDIPNSVKVHKMSAPKRPV